MTPAESDLLEVLQALEVKLLQHSTRSDADLVAAMLTDDFREFGSSGLVYTRADILEALSQESSPVLTGADFALQVLSPDVALLTYKSTKRVESAAPVDALRSSLWVLRAGTWKMLFHQGTRVA